MKQITLKPARHICSMPACKNTDTYKVSGSPNTLGGFYLCGECIEALARLAGIGAADKTRAAKKESAV